MIGSALVVGMKLAIDVDTWSTLAVRKVRLILDLEGKDGSKPQNLVSKVVIHTICYWNQMSHKIK